MTPVTKTCLVCFALWPLLSATRCSKGPVSAGPALPGKTDMHYWLTTADKQVLFKEQPGLSFSTAVNGDPAITVDTTATYQTMDGFGYCLTGGSAYLIGRLPAAAQNALLQELFSTSGNGIGISYLRISIGSSDLDDHVFSYDDLPDGQTDTAMAHFSLGADTVYLIPVLKQILAINPDLKILASPWSAPVWMKTNHSTTGGSLEPQYYPAYAKYFVKYIETMKAAGIPVDAITIQNEPLNPGNNPSMVMQSAEQAAFIKEALGPAFRAAGLNTKIILYDHNCDRPDYPLAILANPAAAQYVDGSAFHLYAGDISALTQVHDAHPDKNVYFTEQWTGGPGNFGPDLDWAVQNLIIGASRNWSRNVLEWNLASDPNYEPHTPGGCTTCMGALTIGSSVTRNPSYYIIASASKFVRPGAVPVASNMPAGLPNVAFQNKDGSKVLIVLNNSKSQQAFNISFNGKSVSTSLEAGAVATYVW